MNDLVELVNLLNKTKLRIPGAWDNILEPGSRMERLFQLIAQKGELSDEELRQQLYGPDEDGGSVPSLRNKLKDRLMDAVYLLDFKDSNFSTRQKAFFDCYKKWGAAMILLIRGAKNIGIDQLEKLLRNAIRFDFTELTLDILRLLRLQYSTVEGDFKRYEAIRNQFKYYEKVWVWENMAEDYYTDLMIRYTNSKSTQVELVNKAKEYYAELEPLMQACASFKLHLFGRMINVLVYSTVNDYANTARVCEDAVAFFNQKEYDSGLPLQVFYYNLIVSYLQLREFDKGQSIVERTIGLFEDGSFNWFKIQELFFLLAMHTGHYDEAYRIFQRVTSHGRFDAQMPQIIEMWKIFQGYLYYLIKIGKVSKEVLDVSAGKFRIGKLMNELSLFIRDKRGMNISILVVQILFSLSEKDYGDTSDRIDAIEKYCSRYLKENDTYRSNCFIRMLLQLPQANFHREAVRRKTEKLLGMLHAVPLEAANQAHEIEIIPYESLWEMTVESLDLKIHKIR